MNLGIRERSFRAGRPIARKRGVPARIVANVLAVVGLVAAGLAAPVSPSAVASAEPSGDPARLGGGGWDRTDWRYNWSRYETYTITSTAGVSFQCDDCGAPGINVGGATFAPDGSSRTPVRVEARDASGAPVPLTVCQDPNRNGRCGEEGEPKLTGCGAVSLDARFARYWNLTVFVRATDPACPGPATTGTLRLIYASTTPTPELTRSHSFRATAVAAYELGAIPAQVPQAGGGIPISVRLQGSVTISRSEPYVDESGALAILARVTHLQLAGSHPIAGEITVTPSARYETKWQWLNRTLPRQQANVFCGDATFDLFVNVAMSGRSPAGLGRAHNEIPIRLGPTHVCGPTFAGSFSTATASPVAFWWNATSAGLPSLPSTGLTSASSPAVPTGWLQSATLVLDARPEPPFPHRISTIVSGKDLDIDKALDCDGGNDGKTTVYVTDTGNQGETLSAVSSTILSPTDMIQVGTWVHTGASVWEGTFYRPNTEPCEEAEIEITATYQDGHAISGGATWWQWN